MQSIISILENQIPRSMNQTKVVGLSIAITNAERLVWHRGFGFKNAVAQQPVDGKTIFEAASLSKPVFAYGVMKLCADGVLDLDTPLNKYLAEPYIPDEPRLEVITARHVLSHTCGFPNWRPKGKLLQVHFHPGERFSYSGEGYVYLQRVIETLTGQSLPEYSRRVVFEPLGMVDSSYIWLDRYEQQAAQAYDEQGELTEKYKEPAGNAAFSLHTTAADFARFMRTFMGSVSNHSHYLAENRRREMLTPQIQVNNLAPWHPAWPKPEAQLTESLYWGLGWGLARGLNANTFWHWGDNGSFKAFTLGGQNDGLGIIVLTTGGSPRTIWREIVQITIGADHPVLDWLNTVYEQ